MVTINYALREINCKIVYYGPGLSGKTTNLQFVHGKVPSASRGDLISLATEADRTLYFDFLPVDVGRIAGFDTKFQLYTVPGQVFYNATRRLVLRGVDGLVFVADSQAAKMDENIESLNNMYENLAECGIESHALPLVMQWNKRDLPDILPVSVLEEKLNSQGLPSFEAVATTGVGVFDTLKKITKMVLEEARTRAMSKVSHAPREERPMTAEPAVAAVTRVSPDGAMETAAAPVYQQSGLRDVATAAAPPGSRPDTRNPQPAAGPVTTPQRMPASKTAVEFGSRPGTDAKIPGPHHTIHREPSLKVRQSTGSPGVYHAQKSLKVRQKSKSLFARFVQWLFGR